MDLSDGRSLLDESVGGVIVLWCLFYLPHSREGGLELRKLRLSGHAGFELRGRSSSYMYLVVSHLQGPTCHTKMVARGCARGGLDPTWLPYSEYILARILETHSYTDVQQVT